MVPGQHRHSVQEAKDGQIAENDSTRTQSESKTHGKGPNDTIRQCRQ